MGTIMKMIISGAAITMAFLVGFGVINSTIKKKSKSLKINRRSKKQSVKTRTIQQNIDQIYSMMHNSYWKKIGIVENLIIYPVKSSEEPVSNDSFEFRDYGMYRQERGIHFWDGMFLIYNKTKGKFEDSRTHFILRSMAATITDTDEVTLRCDGMKNTVTLNINQYLNSAFRLTKETWNGTLETYCISNVDINEWVKQAIETAEDVILVVMLPSNWNSTQKIRNNWSHFIQGYNTMEEDETGKFITLPRFVLITSDTYVESHRRYKYLAPNIIINVDEEEMINPFEEKNWEWIKLGDNVILRNVKPVPSCDEEVEHFGIYCGLWESSGNVKVDDEVYIYYSNT
ncbi:uncharacterized protein [Linepithema humile]|uniref:uncharacterized protein n=1 Tax=Linepithema humile TaxID=83485 RepID=UPI00062310B3|nr:PREDICTED: uncharacterized protein LOC105679176 [Linepithema humile]